jgi:hypothetical protein
VLGVDYLKLAEGLFDTIATIRELQARVAELDEKVEAWQEIAAERSNDLSDCQSWVAELESHIAATDPWKEET